MLRAIRDGEVDALVVESVAGPQVYTLQGLDAETNRFRGEILAQVSDAVVAVDSEERITYLNAAAERLYGVAASGALGQRLSEIYESRWLRPEHEAAATTVLAGRDEWRGENVHVEACVDPACLLECHLRKRRLLLLAKVHERADEAIGDAEGDALRDERLRDVGRLHGVFGDGCGASRLVEVHVRQRDDERREDAACSRTRREKGAAVLLKVAVVPTRQTLDGRQQSDEVADHGASLSANELEDVGISLLRHHAGAARNRAIELDVPELGG